MCAHPPTHPRTHTYFSQTGPITKLFTSSPDEAIRMPEEDLKDWSHEVIKNGKKVITYTPRPVHSLRLWDAKTRSYRDLDTSLTGAPTSDEVGRHGKSLTHSLTHSLPGMFEHAHRHGMCSTICC